MAGTWADTAAGSAGDSAMAGTWADTAVRRAAPAGQAVVTDASVGGHDEYDRFVLEFSDRQLPGYTVAFEPGTPRQCGSGAPVALSGTAVLTVSLRSAAAHDGAGKPTVRERSLHPGLPVMRAVRLTCDFEGEVSWALGLASRRPFRVFSLEGPPRLVVDVRR